MGGIQDRIMAEGKGLMARVWCVVALTTMLAAPMRPAAQAKADVALRAAMETETVKGDLKGAIEQYKKIAQSSDRAVVARALVRMAECYQKLGDAESRKIYERVVREFTDQKDAAAEARSRLAALQSPAPARAGQAARQVWTGQDAFGAVRGSPSPDGRYLTFLQSGALAVRDLKEGTTHALTKDPGSFDYSAFSPDGRQIAYGWNLRAGNETRSELRILPFSSGDSAQPRIVHRNDETIRIRPIGWTPDGKQVLVLRSLKDGTNQIAMVSVQDGPVRVLKSLMWNYATLSLSPDGRYIAYDALSGDNTSPSEIFVLAADGSRETMVVQGTAGNGSPLWSPDGSRLLFLSDRTGNMSLWTLPIEEGKPKGPAELAKADIGRVRLQGLTRSGTLYYLVSGILRQNIYIAELDAAVKATKPPALATERFINSNNAPTWSPDGQYLAYLSSRAPSVEGLPSTVLVIRTLKTGEERDISLPLGTFGLPPRWFPDGGSLLVSPYQGRDAMYYRVDLASGRAELLHAAKGAFAAVGIGANTISRDGKTIFYIGVADASARTAKLVQFDLESRRETVLKTGVFGSLALSPDGTQLALHSSDGTPGGCYLEVMPAGGGGTREVARAADCNALRLGWSPNNYLLFAKGMNTLPNVLWRVPVAGGEPEQIGISMTGQLRYPEVSPDGRRMTFGVSETGASEVWTLENFLPAVNAR